MSSETKEPQEPTPSDERSVDAFLTEAGIPDDGGLRELLLQLRTSRVTEVPAPSAAVAALMGGPGTGLPGTVQPAAAEVVVLKDWSRRHPRKKRVVFTTLAVAASLGVAGGAAAGNETLRRQAEGTINNIVRSFTPAAPELPVPAPASEAPASEAPVVPAAVDPSSDRTLPADHAAPDRAGIPDAKSPGVEVTGAGSSGTGPGAGEPRDRSGQPDRPAQAPAEAGAPSAVPPAGAKPAEPGAEPGQGEAAVPPRPAQPPAGGAKPSDDPTEKAKQAPLTR